MKATEIIDYLINYLEADFETYNDEDGGHVKNTFDFTAARAALEKKYPHLDVDAIFKIARRHVSVTWKRHKEENGVCFEPEFNIDKRAEEEIDSLISFKRRT